MNFSVKMTDMLNDIVLYDNKRLALFKRYSTNNAVTSADYDNRDDAEEGVYEDLFTKIIQNTLEDW